MIRGFFLCFAQRYYGLTEKETIGSMHGQPLLRCVHALVGRSICLVDGRYVGLAVDLSVVHPTDLFGLIL